jgi:T5SS/PEP-CTERM-associated repeat protein
MTRSGASIARSLVAAAVAWWLTSGGLSLAQDNDFWDRPPGGFWEFGANWADGSVPGTLDRATFNVAGTYLVEFGTAPQAIRELNLTAGQVTFNSPGTFRTLNVNSTSFGGPQDVNITNGATLTLGTVTGFVIQPLHLTVGDTLSVSSGSTLNARFGSDVVTSKLNSLGQINVTGLGSALTITGSSGNDANINGGSVNVTGGGEVQTTLANFNGTSLGTVSGAGSQWIDTDIMRVGGNGEGTLNITAGGQVQSVNGIIGDLSTGVGNVTVSGANSEWNNSGVLVVGRDGSGTMNVTGGGTVSSTDGFLSAFPASDGTATITGGAWTMTGRLYVGGNAILDTGGFATLNIQPAGIVSAAQGVIFFADAHVNLQGGTLDASAISYDQGIQGSQLQWTSGTLHVGTFNGSLTNSGGVLAPGHSAGSTTINGNYAQVTGGVIEIEIGGPLAGSEFDFVNVTGSAQVGGELDLTLPGGFTPTPAQTFAILISNGLSGAFDNVASGQRMATSDGRGSFLVNYGFGSPFDDNQVILSAFLPSIPGDYNEDGAVNAADYTVWRNNLGSVTVLANDDTPGVGPDDYTRWKNNFGQTAGSGSGANANVPVPEPTTLALVILGAIASITARRARVPNRDSQNGCGSSSRWSAFGSGILWGLANPCDTWKARALFIQGFRTRLRFS